MKRKFPKSLLLAIIISLLLSTNVFANELIQDVSGIHYQKDDGTFLTSSWIEICGKWFFFDEKGVCTTPVGLDSPKDDGYYQIVTSPVLYTAPDQKTLESLIVNGIVIKGTDKKYYLTPEAATIIRNTKVSAATSSNTQSVAATSKESKNNQSLKVEEKKVDKKTESDEVAHGVWISATGSKYHNKSKCGNMNPNKAKKISLKEAEKLGYQACKKCFY